MEEQAFYDYIKEHYKQQLPFVVYRHPHGNLTHMWLQNDAQVFHSSDYTETGFVFSPFDIKEDNIIFPETECQRFSTMINRTTEAIEHQEVDPDREAGKAQHIHLVDGGITTIKTGALDKVVLSREIKVNNISTDVLTLYRRLQASYHNAMVYCWYHPKVGTWLGATPEILLKTEGQRFETISLAGTKEITADSEPEWTSKEIEEQDIVTKYIVKQLEQDIDNIKPNDTITVKAGNLLHLKTKISGVLKTPSSNLKSIIEALHPTPAVCGFPKEEALDYIMSNEGYDRQFYTGFLGELNVKQPLVRNTNRKNVENNAYNSTKNTTSLYVNLRCLQLKDEEATLYVGGGITKDSVPVNEWEETIAKSKTMLKVLF